MKNKWFDSHYEMELWLWVNEFVVPTMIKRLDKGYILWYDGFACQ